MSVVVKISGSPSESETDLWKSSVNLLVKIPVLLSSPCFGHGYVRIRRLMTFVWFLHVATLAVIIAFSFQSPTRDGVFGVLMAVQQLFIGKVIDSLDKMYNKTMRVQTDALVIKHRIVRIVKIHEEYRKIVRAKHADHEQKLLCVENTIQNVAVGLNSDIRAFMDEIKLLELVTSSFMWKSPKLSSFLDAGVLDTCVTELRTDLDSVR